MKRSLLVVGVILLTLVSFSCKSPEAPAAPSPADIEEVSAVQPSEVKASGATTFAASPAAVTGALATIDPKSDPLVADFAALMPTTTTGNIVGAMQDVAAKAISTKVQDTIDKITKDIDSFPTTKSLDESIDLSGEALGTYFMLKTAKASFTLAATTVDGGAINKDSVNIDTINGTATASLVVEPTTALSGAKSVIKDCWLKMNAGGVLSVTTKADTSGRIPDKIALTGADSAAVSLSFCGKDGTGGKLVVTTSWKYDGTFDYATLNGMTADQRTAKISSELSKNITITVTCYNDSNTAMFTKTYTSAEAFQADFMPTASK